MLFKMLNGTLSHMIHLILIWKLRYAQSFQALLTLSHSVSNFCYYPQSQVAYLTKDTTKFDVHLMLRWNADGGVDGDL
jgi:hypothetical protein